jgi:hypothetical protein
MSKLWKKIRQAVPSLREERGQALRQSSGQAYIEVLLVLPLFIVFIVGVTYFGRAWYAKIAAEMAAYDKDVLGWVGTCLADASRGSLPPGRHWPAFT